MEATSALDRCDVTAGFCAAAVLAISTIAVTHCGATPFSFALDDPYIHLAAAEGAIEGRLGINTGEASAPTSSLLYLLISCLAILSGWPQTVLWMVGATSTVMITAAVCRELRGRTVLGHPVTGPIAMAVSIGLSYALGIHALALMGMEQTLLVFAAVLWAIDVDPDRIHQHQTSVGITATVAALIRYEGLVIWAVTIALLIAKGSTRRTGYVVLTVVGLSYMAWSAYLVSMGLSPIPTSVVAKLLESSSIGQHRAWSEGLQARLNQIFAVAAVGWALPTALLLATTPIHLWRKPLTWVASVGSVPLIFYLMATPASLNGRYESCAYWLLAIGPLVLTRDRTSLQGFGLVCTVVIALWLGYQQWPTYSRITLAAQQVRQQQGLMHDLAVDFWKQPVAANDIGWLSFSNSNYVLDLYGLATPEILQRRVEGDFGYLIEISKSRTIKMALIYDHWFAGHIPDAWVPIGHIRALGVPVTIAGPVVSVWATESSYEDEVRRSLESLRQLHPALVELSESDLTRSAD